MTKIEFRDVDLVEDDFSSMVRLSWPKIPWNNKYLNTLHRILVMHMLQLF